MEKSVIQDVYGRSHAAAAMAVKHGGHPPMVMHWRGGRIEEMFLIKVSKDACGQLLRSMRRNAAEGSVYVFINEAWALEVKHSDDIAVSRAAKEREQGKGVRDMTGRYEAVVFTLFGKGFEYQAICKLGADRSLGKDELIDTTGRSDGRLSTN